MSTILHDDAASSESAPSVANIPCNTLAAIGVVTLIAVGFAQKQANAQTFQSAINALAHTACPQPNPEEPARSCESFGIASGPGGQVEVQTASQWQGIEQHLRALRCLGDQNADCLQPGGAAADSTPFDGLNLFVSADYQNKDKEEAGE